MRIQWLSELNISLVSRWILERLSLNDPHIPIWKELGSGRGTVKSRSVMRTAAHQHWLRRNIHMSKLFRLSFWLILEISTDLEWTRRKVRSRSRMLDKNSFM